MQSSSLLSKTPRPLAVPKTPVRACPHCKEGGEVIIGKYVTISIGWDADHGCWHCLICGFIGFGTDFELLQYPIVACVGHTPRLPGQPRKKKIKY
jgi:hypothetical protein